MTDKELEEQILIRLKTLTESHPVTDLFLGKNLQISGKALEEGSLIEVNEELTIDTEAFSKLFMVPNGSYISISEEDGWGYSSEPPGQYVKWVNEMNLPGHENSVGLYNLENSRTGIFLRGVYVDHLFIDKNKAPPKFGLVAFIHLAITAYQAQFSEITLLAGGGGAAYKDEWAIRDMVGYFVWPKFGFDAQLESFERSSLPEHLKNCQTVRDVTSIDPEWWKKNGNGRAMRFDLRLESNSWQTLLHYSSKALAK